MARLDYYDDAGKLLSELIDGGSELAKVASLKLKESLSVDKGDRDAFLDEEFAVSRKRGGEVVERYYPIADLGNTLTSYLYFNETGGELPESVREVAESRIMGALSKHGLPVGGDEAVLEKAASSTFRFAQKPAEKKAVHTTALTFRGERYGFTGEEQLQKLASSFSSQMSLMSPVEKREIALQLCMHGADLGGPLEKYASMDMSGSRTHYYNRRRAILKNTRPDALRTLDDIYNIDDLEKQAVLLDRLDKETLVRGVPDAFLTVFGERKRAERTKYTEESLEKVASIMGEDVRKVAESGRFHKLSREHNRVLGELLEEMS